MAILNTTSSLSNEVAVYYERVFLERAKARLVHQEGAQLRSLDGNSGKEVIFNRFSPLALALTPLTEGNNPTPVGLTDTQVTVTLAEYGNTVQVTRLLGTTDIDSRDEQKIDVVAQNMGESLKDKSGDYKLFLNIWEPLRHLCTRLCDIIELWKPEASNLKIQTLPILPAL